MTGDTHECELVFSLFDNCHLCHLCDSSQVTLRADNPCRYVAWRRKKLYLLFAKHRYIAKIFALIVRNDIAEKLYSLNDKAFNRSGHRYDLRLPSYCHMPGTELEKGDGFLQVAVQRQRTAWTHSHSRFLTVCQLSALFVPILAPLLWNKDFQT